MSLQIVKTGGAYTLADCGVFAALAVVLVLISTYVPLLGFAASFVWAVPVIIVVLRRGVAAGALTSLVTLVLSLVFTGPIVGYISGNPTVYPQRPLRPKRAK